MRRVFYTAKLAVLFAATLCLLAIARAAVDLSDTLADTDRAVNSIAQDVHATSSALQGKLDRLDPLAAQAGTDLESLDRAIKTHERAIRRASDELHGSFQNLNAVLIQAGLTSDEVRLASLSQREALGKQNEQLTAALGDLRGVLADTRKAVSDPAIHETLANVNATSTDIQQAVNELTHPPKQTRGQRALKWFLQIVLGNGIQGAVRR
jgi:ABC-type transporter Mla subunit MlaD